MRSDVEMRGYAWRVEEASDVDGLPVFPELGASPVDILGYENGGPQPSAILDFFSST
jgi:hypothetical protein